MFHEDEREHLTRERLQILKAMIDSSPMACCVTDENFIVLDCNQVTLDLFQLKDKQEYCERFPELSPMYQPDGTPSKLRMSEILNETFANGKSQFEWMHCTLDGTLIPCEVILKLVKLDGKLVKIGYIQDMRKRNEMTARLEEALEALKIREKLFSTVNRVAEMLLTVENNGDSENSIVQSMELIGHCLSADSVALLRVNLSPEEISLTIDCRWLSEFGQQLQSMNISGQLPRGILPKCEELLFSGKPFNGPITDLPENERQIIDPSGSIKSVYIIPIFYREQMWGIFSIANCTGERILSEEEMGILKSASLMITSVRRRLEQEAEMYRIEIAEESNRAKSRFLARTSHEIRTPVSAVLGISEIQLQSLNLTPTVEEAFVKIHNSSKLLLSIINDILDHSKIEVGKMVITQEEYDVASLISNVSQTHLIYLDNTDIKFHIYVDEKIPVSLVGDAPRIEQVVGNLLSNSFKYTTSGTVELSLQSQNDGLRDDYISLVITVRDTGLGMTHEQLESLYVEYERFHKNEISSATGTGLGMSIVHGLVQMMEAQIDVESEVGKGTTVVVRIPQKISSSEVLGKEMADNLQQFEEYTYAAAKRFNFVPEPMPYGKVLVVDDVEVNLYVAEGLLELYDLNIETCKSGQEAINKIKQGMVYDIIFLDHMMPGLDGFETMRIMRDMGYIQPIVALTANALIGQAEKFIEGGFDGFISKPIQTKLLNTVLIKHIRKKQPPEVIKAAKATLEKKRN